VKTISERDILSAQQVANLLQVSDDTIYELVRQQKIPYKRVGKQIRFLGWAIIEWLEDGDNVMPAV
jgi:excisionase family DNA binding protein